MKLLRKRDIPEEKYSNAFLGFGPETSNFVVERTYSMHSTRPLLLYAFSQVNYFVLMFCVSQTMVLAHMILELALGILPFQLKM